MSNTPSYISTLLQPNGRKGSSRRVWSIDLEHVWVPFFTATNVAELTEVPCDALGAPLRLAHAKDGSVRFSQTGRPVFRVAPELQQQITLVRENFTAGLVKFAGQVIQEYPDAYRSEVEAAQKAAEPIHNKARAEIDAAIALSMAAAMEKATGNDMVSEAEAIVAAEPKPKRKKAEPASTPEPEAVTV